MPDLSDYAYFDDGLTVGWAAGGSELPAAAVGAGSGDGYFLVGTPNAAIDIVAASNVGVDPITLSLDDSAPGAGVEVSHVRLALSQALLDSATPGAPLNIGQRVIGGVGNAVKVWYRFTNTAGITGTSREITLNAVPLAEVANGS